MSKTRRRVDLPGQRQRILRKNLQFSCIVFGRTRIDAVHSPTFTPGKFSFVGTSSPGKAFVKIDCVSLSARSAASKTRRSTSSACEKSSSTRSTISRGSDAGGRQHGRSSDCRPSGRRGRTDRQGSKEARRCPPHSDEHPVVVLGHPADHQSECGVAM